MVPLHGYWDPVREETPTANFDSNDLQQVLNELPEEFRAPLVLYYFQEFGYRQIADQLGVPIGTVMSRLARAKTHLRRRLEALDPLRRRASRTVPGGHDGLSTGSADP